jgi:hypothetical protein
VRTLDELVDRYKREATTLTQRELALLEQDIRNLWPDKDTLTGPTRSKQREHWLRDQLGGGSLYERRHRLALLISEGAEVLWERLDNGMPLGTASRLLMQVRSELGPRSRKNPRLMRQALAEALAKHDRLPPPNRDDGQSEGVGAARPTKKSTVSWSSDREFWAFLRRNLLDFADQSLMDVPGLERDLLASDFERDLDALFDHHRQRWSRARAGASHDVKVSKRKLENSLRLLHMDLPRRGEDIDAFLNKARKQQRTLARLYHPDSNRGDDSLRRQYEAVISAYGIVERWVALYKAEKPTPEDPRSNLRVVQGGKKE